MCDTLCAVGRRRTLFAKNSDRLPDEAQVLEALPPRAGGGTMRTQYLEIEDLGAAAVLGSRPAWLWGLEHGVNEHRVAIGNEQVWTVDTADPQTPGMLGMDLVRLGLERAHSAEHAVDVMTSLLERHGQSGAADTRKGEAYFSSFLVADPSEAWVLETSDRSWVAKRIGTQQTAALTNRLTLRDDWDRASPNIPPGADFDRWRDSGVPTLHADRRLAASRHCLGAAPPDDLDVGTLVAHLRDHDGEGPPPQSFVPFGEGVTVCMHLGRHQATTAAMVVDLPADPEAPVVAWAALGSPCVSVFVPCLAPDVAPVAMSQVESWERLARLARSTETSPELWARVSASLRAVEAELWAEAADLTADPVLWRRFVEQAWARVESVVNEQVAATR